MAMVDLLQRALEFAAPPPADPKTEDLSDFVGQQSKQTHIARTFEQFMNREVAPEDEIPAVLDLLNRMVALQIDRLSIGFAELRSYDQSPVIEALADDIGIQAVGGGLQGGRICGRQEGVVILAECDFAAQQFPLDVVMAVQIIRDLERQEGTHAHCYRSQHFIANVKVIVGVAAALSRDDAVVRILDGVPRHRGPEGWSHFHALQNEIDPEAILALHALEIRADIILFAHALFRPLDWNSLLAGEGIHPTVVVASALAQNLLCDHAGV